MVHRPNQMNALIQFLITISEYTSKNFIDTQKAEGEYERNCGEGWLQPNHSSYKISPHCAKWLLHAE